MITPKDMTRFTNNEIVNMYGSLNQRLTKTIIAKLRKQDVSSFTKAQIKSLIRQGGNEVFYEALNKTNGLTSKRKKEIIKLYNDIGETEMKGYKTVYDEKGLEYKLSPTMIQILNQAIKTSNGTLNNLTRSIAYSSKTTYVKALDELYKDVVSGSYDYSSAIKKTVRDLTEKGITLKTSDGRNEKIDVAVKRNLYTSIKQTADDVAEQVGKEIDYNCVRIFHSTKCRPSHIPIDDVTMSIKEFEKYEYLTEEPNCNHIVNYDWKKEYETETETKYGDEHLTESEYINNYNKLQKQNYYARQVRAKKSEIASGNNTDEAKNQLKLAQAKYRTYSKANDLTVDYDKTWQVGYNK